MPYKVIDDLPNNVRHVLPRHAQEIYRAAFNRAWSEFATLADRESRAHRVAWSAVKRKYEKVSGQWVLSHPEAR